MTEPVDFPAAYSRILSQMPHETEDIGWALARLQPTQEDHRMSDRIRNLIRRQYEEAGLEVTEAKVREIERRSHFRWLAVSAWTDPPQPDYLAHDVKTCPICSQEIP